MARKDEAVDWLKKGSAPPEIAVKMGISLKSVMGYLYNQVGEGKIRRADILFSFKKETRDSFEREICEIRRQCKSETEFDVARFVKGRANPALGVYLDLRDSRVVLGDMYEIIREIEVFLHRAIREILMEEYGPGEHGWWRMGVKREIRDRWQHDREYDGNPAAEPYCYANIVDLIAILDKQWKVFEKVLPHNIAHDKSRLLRGLDMLKDIRNSVMHPVRGKAPTEDNFEFLRNFRDYIGLSRWPFKLTRER